MADNRASQRGESRRRRLFAATETTYGTQVKPVATDAFKMLSGAIESHVPNRIERDDNRPSRSLEAQITGNIPPVAWSYEGYVIPSGTAGTPPDIHKLLLAALGTDSYTNTPATSDVYELTDTCLNRGSLSLYEAYASCDPTAKDCIFMETLLGAIVSTMSIKGSSGEPPTISLGGVGATYILTGRTDINDGSPDATTTVTNSRQCPVGSLIAVYEEADGTTLVSDNSGVGIQVTAANFTTHLLTLDFDISGDSAADNDIIAPWCPTETTAGTPIPGSTGSLTIEGTTVDLLSYEVNLDNGDTPEVDEAFSQVMSGYYEGKRRVTGQVTFRAKASDMAVLARREAFANQTISIVLGETAGSILTVAIECELGFASIEKAAEAACICVAPFKGVATSANAADELKLTFT